MKDIKDVQTLINERASKRLREDIINLQSMIREYGNDLLFYSGIRVNIGTVEKPSNISLIHVFDNRNGLGDEIYDANIEKYKSQEAKMFLEKVDSLREDVNNLLSVNNNDHGD